MGWGGEGEEDIGYTVSLGRTGLGMQTLAQTLGTISMTL